jgi:hypothetical protein
MTDMTPRHKEAGFAFPIALLVLLVTTGAVLTSLNQASSERRVVDSDEAGNSALVMAETGLQQVATRWQSWGFAAPPAATFDSTRIDFPNGFTDVVWQRVRPAAANVSAIYLIRSRGVYTQGGWGGAPVATRVVTRYASWQMGSVDIRAAWTSLTGLQKNGGSGTISGTDACGVAPAVAGVAVPTNPGYNQSGGSSVPSGTPNILYLGPNSTSAADSINVDWDAIVNDGAIPFDVVIPPAAWPAFPAGYWPVIYIDNPGGTFSLPGNGRGILIVRGSLTISGSRTWDGVILVGQVLTSNGNNTVEGGVITGLNVQLGESVPISDVGNGNKTYRYNSCKVASAMAAQASLRVMTNTWFDGWALY